MIVIRKPEQVAGRDAVALQDEQVLAGHEGMIAAEHPVVHLDRTRYKEGLACKAAIFQLGVDGGNLPEPAPVGCPAGEPVADPVEDFLFPGQVEPVQVDQVRGEQVFPGRYLLK